MAWFWGNHLARGLPSAFDLPPVTASPRGKGLVANGNRESARFHSSDDFRLGTRSSTGRGIGSRPDRGCTTKANRLLFPSIGRSTATTNCNWLPSNRWGCLRKLPGILPVKRSD